MHVEVPMETLVALRQNKLGNNGIQRVKAFRNLWSCVPLASILVCLPCVGVHGRETSSSERFVHALVGVMLAAAHSTHGTFS